MEAGLRIADMAEAERPRERLAERGPGAVTTAELLAILLRTGRQGASAIDIGRSLMKKFGGLDELARASLDDLQTVEGIGFDKAVTVKAAFEIARRFAEDRRREAPLLDNPEAIEGLLRAEAASGSVERLQVLLLNARRRLIRVETVADGLLDQLLVHPREVFRAAIAAKAHSIILAHNHPSGDPTPSDADIKVTRDLIRAGRLLKIEVVDHVILGREQGDPMEGERTASKPMSRRGYVSLRELGYFHE